MNEYPITIIDLLRHGECVNGDCYRGSIDVELNENGYQQMSESIQSLIPLWSAIISSPLIRCAKFSRELAHSRQIPLQFDDNLRELHFGDWEGEPINKIWQEQREQAEAWWRDPVAFPPPNGEAADVFSQRVITAWEKLLTQYCGERLLIVSHGGVMKALLAHVLSMPIAAMNNIDLPFACLSRIEVTHLPEGNYSRLVYHNLTHKGGL